MAKNKGNTRKGAVKDRKQYFNERIKKYVKFDTNTGKILSCSSTKYKGVSLKMTKAQIESAQKAMAELEITQKKSK